MWFVEGYIVRYQVAWGAVHRLKVGFVGNSVGCSREMIALQGPTDVFSPLKTSPPTNVQQCSSISIH